MFYKESENFLTKENISFIKNVILTDMFPFYLKKEATFKDSQQTMSHILLKRKENPLEKSMDKNRINSPHYDSMLNLALSFFKKFNIDVFEILRMSVNLTFNNGHKKCPIHVDHPYPHKQLIIYLNDADPSSKTVILNKKGKILKIITPKKYKGICFESLPHYLIYPKKGLRIILIVTFR